MKQVIGKDTNGKDLYENDTIVFNHKGVKYTTKITYNNELYIVNPENTTFSCILSELKNHTDNYKKQTLWDRIIN